MSLNFNSNLHANPHDSSASMSPKFNNKKYRENLINSSQQFNSSFTQPARQPVSQSQNSNYLSDSSRTHFMPSRKLDYKYKFVLGNKLEKVQKVNEMDQTQYKVKMFVKPVENHPAELIEQVTFKLHDPRHHLDESVTRKSLSRAQDYSYTPENALKSKAVVANVTVKFKDGQALHLHHKLTETAEEQSKEYLKPFSGLYQNPNNYVAVYNMYYNVQMEFAIPAQSKLANAYSIMNTLKRKTGIEFEYTGEPTNMFDKWLVYPNKLNKFYSSNQSTFIFEIYSQKLIGKESFDLNSRWVNALYDIHCKTGEGCYFYVGVSCADWALLDFQKVVANFIKFEEVFDRLTALNYGVKLVRGVRGQWPYMSEAELLRELLSYKSIMRVIKLANPNNDGGSKINLVDAFANNMVQFRLKESTTDAAKVNLWVQLILRFVDSARRREYPKAFDEKRSVQFKIEKFFEWMVVDSSLCQFWEREIYRKEMSGGHEEGLTPKFSRVSLNSSNYRYNIQNYNYDWHFDSGTVVKSYEVMPLIRSHHFSKKFL